MPDWDSASEAERDAIDTGLKHAGAVAALFHELTANDVDVAAVWAIQQQNDKALATREGTGTDLRAGGKMLAMLSQNTQGMVPVILSRPDQAFDLHAFADRDSQLIVINSRSGESEEISIDMARLLGATGDADLQILTAAEGADPRDPDVEAEFEAVDAAAALQDGLLTLTLEPWEVAVLRVEAGNDTLTVEDAAVTFFGGNGDDVLFGAAGDDLLAGGLHDDALVGAGGDDTLRGNDGMDTLVGRAGDDLLEGGNGDDRLFGTDGADTLVGGEGADTMIGGLDGNNIFGMAGDDRAFGNSGDDLLTGDAGNDELFGQDGDDVIVGGTGEDTLRGGTGSDTLDGDLGDDFLAGDLGADRITGGSGNDSLYGGFGADWLEGGAGADFLGGVRGATRSTVGPGTTSWPGAKARTLSCSTRRVKLGMSRSSISRRASIRSRSTSKVLH